MQTQQITTPSIKLLYPYRSKDWFGNTDDYRQAQEIDYQLLRNLNNDYTKAMNLGTESLYRELLVKGNYPELLKQYGKAKENGDDLKAIKKELNQLKSNARKRAYKDMRQYADWISTSVIACAIRDVRKEFNDWYKNRYERSISHFKSQPVKIPSSQYYLRQDENGYYYIDFRVFSKWAKANRMRIGLLARGYPKAIIEKMVTKSEKPNDIKMNDWKPQLLAEGKFIAGEAQIYYDDEKINNWAIQFSYERKIREKKKSDTQMGIDLGVNYAIYAALNNSWKRLRIRGGKIKYKRKQLQKTKRSLGDATRGGFGTVATWDRKQNLGHHESEFIRTRYHQLTAMIVNFARGQGVSVVYMEDHTQLSKCLISSWAPELFYRLLEYKLEAKGIKLVEINPAYSSQRCYNCGFIHPDNRNRENGDWFKCLNCEWGHFEQLPKKEQYKQKINGDYNASKNLSTGWEYDPETEFNHHVDLLSKKINISPEKIKKSLTEDWADDDKDRYFHQKRKEVSDIIIDDNLNLSQFQKQLRLL